MKQRGQRNTSAGFVRAAVAIGCSVVLMLCGAVSTIHAAGPPDSLVLSLDKGPGASDVSLQWSSGVPLFEVHRDTDPTAIGGGAQSRIALTDAQQWVDQPPTAGLQFYLVFSQCGNGELDSGEQCDDGNQLAGDDCLPDCTLNVDAGLVAGYAFDEPSGSTVLDASPNGFDGTLMPGATRNASGFHGAAAETDGSGGRVELGEIDVSGTELTVAMWFRADDLDNFDGHLLTKSSGTSANDHLWSITTFGPRLRCLLKTDSGSTTTLTASTTTIQTQTWTHVALTYDGSQVRLYQNGVSVRNTSRTGQLIVDPTIGVRLGAGPSGGQFFDGRIDDVRIFARALTAEEVGALMGSAVGGAVCGDGVQQAGEGCDNGAANSDTAPDACRSDCTPASCGDGVTDSGEGCDDGAGNSDTAPNACRSSCDPASCGDGIVDSGETCDDGNQIAEDGCEADCTESVLCGNGVVDAGEACDDGAGNSDSAADACRTDCTLAGCGDGVIDTGEECDDGLGNIDFSPDACRSTCMLASCGDGTLDTGEICDDGNTESGDGCSAVCGALRSDDFSPVLREGWEFIDPLGDASFTTTGAGTEDAQLRIIVPGGPNHDPWITNEAPRMMFPADDVDFELEVKIESVVSQAHHTQGVLVEQDDGTWLRFDFYSNGTRWFAFAATMSNRIPAVRLNTPIGSGPSPPQLWMRVARQGNQWTASYSTVSSSSGWVVAGAFSFDMAVTAAGVFAGNFSNSGASAPGLEAVFDYFFETNNPIDPEDPLTCGDGILDPGESCDAGAANSNAPDAACRPNCEFPSCGDGTVDTGEACDDGNVEAGDGCSPSCGLEGFCGDGTVDLGEICDAGAANSNDPDAACRPDCQPRRCGDSITDSDEDCDDGNQISGDGCQAGCVAPACGDGVLDAGEACDDGNTINADGCQADCELPVCGDGVVDSGESCDLGGANSDAPDASCRTDCTPARCGDGVLDSSEFCDDGNNIGGDGCAANCLSECGNGVINGDEQCDEGAANSDQPDATCRTDCTPGRCGDGILDSGETCDDANNIDDDGCSASCVSEVEFCGNGLVESGEDCDDGNVVSGDGCSATCHRLLSDDFSPLLDPGWTFVDPKSDASFAVTGTGTVDTHVEITVPAGPSHDPWIVNEAPRLMQSVDDVDFTVRLKIESSISQLTQTQGIIVEQDDGTWIRFDMFTNGAEWHPFSATFDDGTATIKLNQTNSQPSTPNPLWLEVQRQGDTWTYRYSTVSASTGYVTAVSFNFVMEVRTMGFFAGNFSVSGTEAPQTVVAFDYFFDVAAPIVPEDPVTCGNGVINPGEQCDEGAGNSNDPDAACRPDCRLPYCGDRVVDSGEQCDDGNNSAGDGCDANCAIEPFCGDAQVDAGEECDEGGNNSNAPNATCRPDCTLAGCGDGITDSGEQCDDGNDVNGDGCQVTCFLPVCGDGFVDDGEVCDAGAGNSNVVPDACRTNCLPARCGDGVTDTGETCDDGNTSSGDACPANCGVEAQMLSFTRVVVDANPPSQTHGKSAGDINGDGFLDVITAGATAGDGIFWYAYPNWTKHEIFPAGITGFTTDLQLGDVDGDGDLDLLIPKGWWIGESVWWYENPRPSGDPATDTWVEHSIGTAQAHDIEIADMNNDGKLDVVVRYNEVTLFLQNSPTSWTKVLLNERTLEGLGLGDLDDDGDMDIALNGYWLENPLPGGNPAQGPWLERTIDTNWPPDTKVVVADVNLDGDQDVVIARSENAGERLSWYSTTNARTGPWVEHVIAAVSDHTHSIRVADMDLDGDMDVITAEMHQSDDPDNIIVHLNEGGGETWTPLVVDNTGSHNLRVADIDLDGDFDIVGANWHGETPLEMWRNDLIATNPLGQWERHVVDDTRPWHAVFIEHGDLNGDNLEDIVAGGFWYPNPGNPAGSWSRETIGSPLNNMATVHDFDADGDLDILGTRGQGFAVNDAFAWARNDGAGNFTVRTNIQSGNGDFLQGVQVGNYQNATQLEVMLSWHVGTTGTQRLTVPTDPFNGVWLWDLVSPVAAGEELSSGDIDRDGDPDLMLGTVWLRNEGTSWTGFGLDPTTDQADRNRLADINGDGRLDVVVGFEANPGKLVWYEQGALSTGNWIEHEIAILAGPMSLDVADMDQDGDFDIVVGEHNLIDTSSAGLFVFENADGEGGVWVAHQIHIGDEHHDGAQVVDIDNDGDLDVISLGITESEVWLYENLAVDSSNPVNLPPNANAGPDQLVIDNDGNGQAVVELDGRASTDDGTIVDYRWFTGAGAIATGANPLVVFQVGVHEVTLRVTDEFGETDTDVTVITIQSP